MERNKRSLLIMVYSVITLTTISRTAGFILQDLCFAPPTCTCTPNVVDCGNRSLVSIHTFQTFHLSGLRFGIVFDNNNLTVIQKNAFANISSDNTSMILLSLRNNSISNLKDGCFNGIESEVYVLLLTNNKLAWLPKVLVSLKKLYNLDLNGNPLANLDSYVMSQIGKSLENIAISISNFVSWPVEMHYLRQLRTLKLYYIPFSNLPYNAFQGFEDNLGILHIINSHLEELPVAICHLNGLHRLIFDNNDNLSGNQLRTEDCHLHIDSMKFLSLRNNSLVEFPHVLRNGSFFSSLDLGYNNIPFIQDKYIPSCRINHLHLNNNDLTRIPYALNRINDLQGLYLGHNDVTSIEDSDFQKLSSLKYLYLEYNNIRFVSNLAFTNNPMLKFIDLSNNHLKSIPEAFALLQYVHVYIYLERNEIDCICIDPGLKSLNTSMITITGNCKLGSERLQSFIASQAPTCG